MSRWDGRHFGSAFESEALERTRAYKKWTEMLLHWEPKHPTTCERITGAKLMLDRLKITQGFDVLEWLQDRFVRDSYCGSTPWIEEFQYTDSWHDANQCLQLCDLLTGAVYQALVPSEREVKVRARETVETALRTVGVKELAARYWKGFANASLAKHFPKFSVWHWRPTEEGRRLKPRRPWHSA